MKTCVELPARVIWSICSNQASYRGPYCVYVREYCDPARFQFCGNFGSKTLIEINFDTLEGAKSAANAWCKAQGFEPPEWMVAL